MRSTDDPTTTTVVSRDGTEIGYFTTGTGPPLLLVHGALRPHLEPHVSVHAMDRRGRGASGDHPDYDVAREIEDVAAVVDAVAAASRTPVDVLGSSAGASFAVGAATLTANVGRLVLFEPPGRQVLERLPDGLTGELDAMLAAGDREGVLRTAYRVLVRLSDQEIDELRAQPAWPNRLAAAHTVPRELRIPADSLLDLARAARVTAPALVLVGGATPEPFKTSAEELAAVLPDARVAVLDGQGHAAEVLAPAVVAERVLSFLGTGGAGAGP